MEIELTETIDFQLSLCVTDPENNRVSVKSILTLTPFLMMFELFTGGILTIRIPEDRKLPSHAF